MRFITERKETELNETVDGIRIDKKKKKSKGRLPSMYTKDKKVKVNKNAGDVPTSMAHLNKNMGNSSPSGESASNGDCGASSGGSVCGM